MYELLKSSKKTYCVYDVEFLKKKTNITKLKDVQGTLNGASKVDMLVVHSRKKR